MSALGRPGPERPHEIGPNKRPTAYFFPEIAHPVEVFEKHGIAVEYCSPLGSAPSDNGYDASDPPSWPSATANRSGAWHAAAACPRSIDGRLITGQNPASAGPLAEAIVRALGQCSTVGWAAPPPTQRGRFDQKSNCADTLAVRAAAAVAKVPLASQ